MFRRLIPSRPECELLGVESTDNQPGNQSIGKADYSVNPAALSDPWFAGTGFTATTSFHNLVGYEWDLITPGCQTPPLTDLFHYPGKVPADGVRYTAPSGARVFSAGTLRFSWGLDPSSTSGDPGAKYDNPGPRRFMRNALDDLTRPAPPISIQASRTSAGVRIVVRRHPDPRAEAVLVYAHASGGAFTVPGPHLTLVCTAKRPTCVDRKAPRNGPVRYAAIVRDRWRQSFPLFSQPVAPSRRGRNTGNAIQRENALTGTTPWQITRAPGEGD